MPGNYERFDDVALGHAGLDALQVVGVEVDVEQRIEDHVEPFGVGLREKDVTGHCGVGGLVTRQNEGYGELVIGPADRRVADLVQSDGHAAEVVGEG